MMMNGNIKKFLIFLLPVIILVSGCGKERAPDPPRSYSRILIELFDSLEKHDHKAARNEITRLRDLDETNVFLAALEITERNNFYISEAQKYIDKKQIYKAHKIVEDALIKYGRDKILSEVESELTVLIQLAEVIDNLNSPDNSVSMAKDIVRINRILKDYDKGNLFKPFVDKKIMIAKELNKKEVERSYFDLCSDIETLRKSDPESMLLLAAQLKADKPDYPILKNIEKILFDKKSFKSYKTIFESK